MTSRALRPCWQNCGGPEEESLLSDAEVLAIDAMEDSIAPLDEPTIQIRRLITGFEACYHEADREAELIIGAIGAGRCPAPSNERPPQRKRELENTHYILSTCCKDPTVTGMDQDVGGIPAEELISFIGQPNSLKRWQVARVVDKVNETLDPNCPYHTLALDVGDYGEPGAGTAGEHYRNDQAFLQQTKETIIHDTVDGRDSKVSLAFAIDLLMPCSWDFVGCLVTILKAIGGNLHPRRPLACCARNIKLSPLCDRLRTISNTLNGFWTGKATGEPIDRPLLASLGTPTPAKRWLAASLDKTIRLHLSQPFDMDLS